MLVINALVAFGALRVRRGETLLLAKPGTLSSYWFRSHVTPAGIGGVNRVSATLAAGFDVTWLI